MRGTITARLRIAVAVAVACLLGSTVSPSTFAATYKCSLAGKHTYQDHACPPEVGERGSESRIDTLLPRQGLERTLSREHVARLNGRAQTDLVPIARSAFDALRTGDMTAYLNLLCPRERIAFGTPAVRENLKTQGESFARGGTRLASLNSADYQKVSFAAIDETVLPGKLPLAGVFIAQFDYEGDRPCVRAVERAGK